MDVCKYCRQYHNPYLDICDAYIKWLEENPEPAMAIHPSQKQDCIKVIEDDVDNSGDKG